MKCEIIIDTEHEEKIVIYAKKENRFTEEIKRIAEQYSTEFLGYKGSEITRLNPFDIYYISVISGKVYAVCKNDKFILKERLYTLEEKLPEIFVKINQSCLANINKAERFDTSISGTLKIKFKNGDTEYVSRRQLKTIKERIGI